MDYEDIFYYKKVFITLSLGGVIYVNVISPLIQSNDDRGITKIPTEFSGFYLIDTSSGSPYTIGFPIIPTFY